MAANDAFTAGVRPGGLTSSTEIRLLLCYLVKNAGPITRQEIENALMEEALVNYFEIGSCLDDITRQQLVTLTKGSYTITDKGRINRNEKGIFLTYIQIKRLLNLEIDSEEAAREKQLL